MISNLEMFPNEILLNVFCYLSWDEILIYLGSLNKRFNSLIYSIFSNNENRIIFNKPDLSYQTFSSILLPLILNSSSFLSSKIKYIHFDGITINGMFKQLLSQIFSGQCQLTSRHLYMTKLRYAIHQCLKSYPSHLPLTTNSNELQSYCVSLRRLHIQLEYTCFLEHLIDRVPNLEQLSAVFSQLRCGDQLRDSNFQRSILSNESWFNKVPKLKCFALKSSIDNYLEFVYLKWLLNNFNHITKLKIYVRGSGISRTGQLIWKSVIDVNFICQHCLLDKIINLKYFHFYIGRTCELSLVNIENTINSFKNYPFFISHQCTNIKYLYDKNES
ncbi:unnamed protein product [Rotaria sp. Silwood2]|nr:unnamed protein product [Rotaria sp. Silwood2]